MFASRCGAADACRVTKAANRMAIYSTPEQSPEVINPPGGFIGPGGGAGGRGGRGGSGGHGGGGLGLED
jgi:hypothetical protein